MRRRLDLIVGARCGNEEGAFIVVPREGTSSAPMETRIDEALVTVLLIV